MGALALLGGSLLAASVAPGAAAATAHRAAAATAHGQASVVARPGGPAWLLSGGAGVRYATSSNWSGYAVHSGTYSSVSASWTEPKGRCRAGDGHDYSSFWVGLDGYNSGTVEQTGTDTDCHGGSARHYAWWEMYPHGARLIRHKVRAGDRLHASVSYHGGGRFTLKLTDVTRHWTATEHRRLRSARRSSAEVIVEAPSSTSGVLPLADFGTVHFSKAMVNGTRIGSRHPTKITMVTNSGRQRDKVTGLSGRSRFSATWLHR